MMLLPLALLAVVSGADGEVTLKVVSTPAGAQVSVDGTAVGKTPFTGKVEPGEHSVELTLDGYERTGKTASCLAQRDCLVSLALKEAPITVSLSSTPIGATATVDGKPVGLTPVDVDLALGKHQLTLALQGHQGVQTTLTVSRKGPRDFTFPLSAPRFQLAVQSTPPGATVRLDGEAVGVTPWTGRTASGPHALELALPGYASATQDVSVLPRPGPTRVAVKLVPVPTALVLTVEPKAARVLLDGKGVVATGAPLPVKPGPHAIAVECPGYETQKLQVDVARGQTVARAVTLSPLEVELLIHVTPADAEVRLDGAVVTVAAPLRVLPGTHQVEARRAGYTTVQHTVEVKPATRGELALALSPAPADPPRPVTPVLPPPPPMPAPEPMAPPRPSIDALLGVLRAKDASEDAKRGALREAMLQYARPGRAALLAQVEPPSLRPTLCRAAGDLVEQALLAVTVQSRGGAPASARVRLDGADLGTAPLERLVPVCSAELVADGEDGERVARALRLEPGQRREVVLTLPGRPNLGVFSALGDVALPSGALAPPLGAAYLGGAGVQFEYFGRVLHLRASLKEPFVQTATGTQALIIPLGDVSIGAHVTASYRDVVRGALSLSAGVWSVFWASARAKLTVFLFDRLAVGIGGSVNVSPRALIQGLAVPGDLKGALELTLGVAFPTR